MLIQGLKPKSRQYLPKSSEPGVRAAPPTTPSKRWQQTLLSKFSSQQEILGSVCCYCEEVIAIEDVLWTVMLVPMEKGFFPTLWRTISHTHKKRQEQIHRRKFFWTQWNKAYHDKTTKIFKNKSFRRSFLTNRFSNQRTFEIQRNYSDTVLRDSVCGGVVGCVDLAPKYILSHKYNTRTAEKLLLFSVCFIM